MRLSLSHFSGYKEKKEPLEAWILRAFTGSETDNDLILRTREFIFLLFGRHMLPDFSRNLVHRIPALRPQLITDVQAAPLAPLGAIWCTSFDCSQLPMHTLVTYRDQLDFMLSDQWRLHVRNGPALAAEVLSYPSDEYIRWYQGITRVYIGNSANRDTRSHGYQPARVDRWMMEPPTDPSQMVVFAKKIQMIIQRCMVSIDGGGLPPVPPSPDRHEHIDPGHVDVERGEGFGGGQPTIDLFDSPNLDIPSFSLGLTQPSQSLSSGSGTLQIPPPPILGFAPFQSPHSTSFGFFEFHAPPPSGTTGLFTPHQPILQTSSSDEEERTDDMDVLQHYGFGHRVGKKTTRFTSFD
ncbi:hypothetical protein M9H77_05110 [Catharanthus roseus]|uniref:Uncharacterized protein n=1 Tax=Catharanthus roseus TaxID=4058 RepID=A0ACC0CGA4_CATRO|nr:hypothetical protein M9H77_05110 [Catharanthus roseus]